MNKSEAYKVLGLDDSSTKEEIEKRYTLLIRKHRSLRGLEITEKSELDIDQIINAYKTLSVEKNEYKENNRLFKKLGIDRQKWSNFIYYNKTKAIVIFLVTALLFVLILDTRKTKTDFGIGVIGDYYITDIDKFKEVIEESVDGINRLYVDNISPKVVQNEELVVNKLLIMFMGNEIDIFICEYSIFEIYVKQGYFRNMEDIVNDLSVDEEDLYKLQIDGEENEKIFGIKTSKYKFLEEAGLKGDGYIVAIKVNTKRVDKTFEVLKLIFNDRHSS